MTQAGDARTLARRSVNYGHSLHRAFTDPYVSLDSLSDGFRRASMPRSECRIHLLRGAKTPITLAELAEAYLVKAPVELWPLTGRVRPALAVLASWERSHAGAARADLVPDLSCSTTGYRARSHGNVCHIRKLVLANTPC
jgi:hypothetical protein